MKNAESPKLRDSILALSRGHNAQGHDGTDQIIANIEKRIWNTLLATTRIPALKSVRAVPRTNANSKRERSNSMEIEAHVPERRFPEYRPSSQTHDRQSDNNIVNFDSSELSSMPDFKGPRLRESDVSSQGSSPLHISLHSSHLDGGSYVFRQDSHNEASESSCNSSPIVTWSDLSSSQSSEMGFGQATPAALFHADLLHPGPSHRLINGSIKARRSFEIINEVYVYIGVFERISKPGIATRLASSRMEEGLTGQSTT